MIIGFTGVIGSGKTEAARVLEAEFGFTRINFKDALDEELLKRFPRLLTAIRARDETPYADNDDLVRRKPTHPLVRALKQNYGTDVRRRDERDYWVDRWAYSVRVTPCRHIVADDVRFLNESIRISLFGGNVYRIVRGDNKDGANAHISETEMQYINPKAIIENNRSLAEFQDAIRAIMSDLVIQRDNEKLGL